MTGQMNIQNGNKRHLDTTFGHWRKSHFSNPNNQCVEVAFSSNAVGLRDSQHPDGAVLVFDHGEWQAFLDAIAAGGFRAA